MDGRERGPQIGIVGPLVRRVDVYGLDDEQPAIPGGILPALGYEPPVAVLERLDGLRRLLDHSPQTRFASSVWGDVVVRYSSAEQQNVDRLGDFFQF